MTIRKRVVLKEGEMNLCTLMYSSKSRSHVDTQPYNKVMTEKECQKKADKYNKKPESQRMNRSGQFGDEYMEKKCVKTECQNIQKCAIM